MGILNITPDSFSDGGKFISPEDALKQAKQLARDGADILDIGAESTRPGAKAISAEEEIERLSAALDLIAREIQIPISIDTTKSNVAEFALKKGAQIVNDVSAFCADSDMVKVVRDYGAGAVLMHRRGNPETMQTLTHYKDVVPEVICELEERLEFAEKNGIKRDALAIDPGLGFSKTADQNFELIKRISEFHQWSLPVVVGASRKSFLRKIAGDDPKDRVTASVTVTTFLANEGVHVLRVHDVRETREAIAVTQELTRND